MGKLNAYANAMDVALFVSLFASSLIVDRLYCETV